jgi:hypothetical protein
MKVKEDFFTRGSFTLGDGSSIRFWEDTWLGGTPLAAQYPSLYSVVRHKDQTVAQILASVPLNIEFRRSLLGARWNRWLHLLHRLIDVQLENHDDEFRWRLTQIGKFTVKSMYLDLLNDNTVYLHKYLWKMKVPLKTKVFMWFVQRKEILTKDNLGCVRFQNEGEWNGMVPFRGHGMVPTPYSVRKRTRNGTVPYCVRLEALGAERNRHNHA